MHTREACLDSNNDGIKTAALGVGLHFVIAPGDGE
jgi:hypothetical protein